LVLAIFVGFCTGMKTPTNAADRFLPILCPEPVETKKLKGHADRPLPLQKSPPN
jgi:hypothetical protein